MPSWQSLAWTKSNAMPYDDEEYSELPPSPRKQGKAVRPATPVPVPRELRADDEYPAKEIEGEGEGEVAPARPHPAPRPRPATPPRPAPATPARPASRPAIRTQAEPARSSRVSRPVGQAA